jgi:hypothetical protein
MHEGRPSQVERGLVREAKQIRPLSDDRGIRISEGQETVAQIVRTVEVVVVHLRPVVALNEIQCPIQASPDVLGFGHLQKASSRHVRERALDLIEIECVAVEYDQQLLVRVLLALVVPDRGAEPRGPVRDQNHRDQGLGVVDQIVPPDPAQHLVGAVSVRVLGHHSPVSLVGANAILPAGPHQLRHGRRGLSLRVGHRHRFAQHPLHTLRGRGDHLGPACEQLKDPPREHAGGFDDRVAVQEDGKPSVGREHLVVGNLLPNVLAVLTRKAVLSRCLAFQVGESIEDGQSVPAPQRTIQQRTQELAAPGVRPPRTSRPRRRLRAGSSNSCSPGCGARAVQRRAERIPDRARRAPGTWEHNPRRS